MLLRLYMDSGQPVKAAALAEKVFARDQNSMPYRTALLSHCWKPGMWTARMPCSLKSATR